jgi:hypothetical protein
MEDTPVGFGFDGTQAWHRHTIIETARGSRQRNMAARPDTALQNALGCIALADVHAAVFRDTCFGCASAAPINHPPITHQ